MSKVRGGWEETPRIRGQGSGQEELPRVRGQWRPGGDTPRPRSGAARRSHLAPEAKGCDPGEPPTPEARASGLEEHPEDQWLRRRRRAYRNYPTLKVRNSSSKEIPLVQSRSSPEEIPHAQSKRNPSKMVGVVRRHQRADTLSYQQSTKTYK